MNSPCAAPTQIMVMSSWPGPFVTPGDAAFFFCVTAFSGQVWVLQCRRQHQGQDRSADGGGRRESRDPPTGRHNHRAHFWKHRWWRQHVILSGLFMLTPVCGCLQVSASLSSQLSKATNALLLCPRRWAWRRQVLLLMNFQETLCGSFPAHPCVPGGCFEESRGRHCAHAHVCSFWLSRVSYLHRLAPEEWNS